MHLPAPSNNLIDSFINGIANWVDKIDKAITTYNDKVARLSVLYARWAYKDTKKGFGIEKDLTEVTSFF